LQRHPVIFIKGSKTLMPPHPHLTDAHHAFRTHVRQTLHARLLPDAKAAEERGHLLPETWRALAEHGLLSLPHDGPEFMKSAIFLDELGQLGYAGVRSAIAVHAYMAAFYLKTYGNDAQRARYLPAIEQGRSVLALAITEEHAGSDLSRMECIATATNDALVVQGSKSYIANGSQATLFMTLASGSRDAHALAKSCFLLIDGATAGLSREPQSMLGWHSADVGKLHFHDAVVPRSNLIGTAGKALLYLLHGLAFERLVAGILALGGATHCIDLLTGFACRHRIGEKPLTDHQSVRHRLADLVSERELLRHYAYQLASRHGEGDPDPRGAAILKLRATELAVSASQLLIQYQGARGYLAESDAARLYRDAAAGTLAGGASEIMRDAIFEETRSAL
jgi:acyl-CoA dehydrogenase